MGTMPLPSGDEGGMPLSEETEALALPPPQALPRVLHKRSPKAVPRQLEPGSQLAGKLRAPRRALPHGHLYSSFSGIWEELPSLSRLTFILFTCSLPHAIFVLKVFINNIQNK